MNVITFVRDINKCNVKLRVAQNRLNIDKMLIMIQNIKYRNT